MRVLVLGGGIVGVTSAYYLARDGHEVVLAEEKEGVGREASAANAGMIAPGHSFAWSSPAAPGLLLRSLLGQETAIRVRLKPDLRLYTWGLRFLRECTSARTRRNTLIKLRLNQYSQAVMTELVRQHRPRPHGLDHGVRHGADRRGHGRGTTARARPGRPRAAVGGRGPLSRGTPLPRTACSGGSASRYPLE